MSAMLTAGAAAGGTLARNLAGGPLLHQAVAAALPEEATVMDGRAGWLEHSWRGQKAFFGVHTWVGGAGLAFGKSLPNS